MEGSSRINQLHFCHKPFQDTDPSFQNSDADPGIFGWNFFER